jgi:hypothetical protein
MHPHLTEVVPEPRFEERAGGTVNRLAGRTQNFVYGGRYLGLNLIAYG